MTMYNDDDAISSALSSRRMAHGRGRNNARGTKNSAKAMFDPQRAIGVYAVKSNAVSSDATTSHLTIHGFSTSETGLLASLRMGGLITGMAVLAGSRKGLGEIVQDLVDDEENEEEDDGGANNEDGQEDEGQLSAAHKLNMAEGKNSQERTHSTDDDEESDENDDEIEDAKSAMELEDDRMNRRAKAFEKNSFRQPKFWICWRGTVKVEPAAEGLMEQNSGYLVFSGNDCSTFEGTLTCKVLQWDNVKFKGYKVKSHAPECTQRWTDFEVTSGMVDEQSKSTTG